MINDALKAVHDCYMNESFREEIQKAAYAAEDAMNSREEWCDEHDVEPYDDDMFNQIEQIVDMLEEALDYAERANDKLCEILEDNNYSF